MGLRSKLFKVALVGGVVMMARSKNRVVNTVGRAAGAVAAPRLMGMLTRKFG